MIGYVELRCPLCSWTLQIPRWYKDGYTLAEHLKGHTVGDWIIKTTRLQTELDRLKAKCK